MQGKTLQKLRLLRKSGKYDGQSQRLRYKTDSIEEAINKSKEDACDKLCNDQDACKKTCIPKIELMNTLCR